MTVFNIHIRFVCIVYNVCIYYIGGFFAIHFLHSSWRRFRSSLWQVSSVYVGSWRHWWSSGAMSGWKWTRGCWTTLRKWWWSAVGTSQPPLLGTVSRSSTSPTTPSASSETHWWIVRVSILWYSDDSHWEFHVLLLDLFLMGEAKYYWGRKRVH